MTTPSSCPSAARWHLYLEGALFGAEQAELSGHLEKCSLCRRTLDQMASGDSLLLVARDVGREQAAQPATSGDFPCFGDVADAEDRTPSPDQAASAALDFLRPPIKAATLGRLGHYDVLSEVGRGGMGVVLRAFDDVLHRVVAIKVLAPELATSATARKRFLREARAAAAIRHEHVIDIHSVEEQPLPYLVMEYVPGQTLQQKLDQTGPLPLKEVLRIGYQIASGLTPAHGQGLIHRDVKPSNILLENGVERVKITDFGLARAGDDASVTQSGVIAGTPQYMSPEQAEGRALDQRSDLFSLGSVLYVMCTGRPPFRAETALAVLKRVCEDTPRPIHEINNDVPEWLGILIAKLHAKRPEDRFQSAQEVADLLAAYLSELQVHGEVQSTKARGKKQWKPAKDSRRRGLAFWRFPVLCCLLALLLAVGVVSAILLRADQWPGGSGDPDSGKGQAQQTRPKRPLPLEELLQLPSPLDKWRWQHIPANLLALVERDLANPGQVPPELVAVFGDARFLNKNNPVYAVAISSDGGTLAAGGQNHAVRLWDLRVPGRSGQPTHVLTRHTDSVWSVAFSPDGTLLASASKDTTIVLWDVATGKEVHTLTGYAKNGSRITFRPDGQTLAAGTEEGGVTFWPVGASRQSRPDAGKVAMSWHAGPVKAVAFSPNGQLLASAGQDQTVRLCEADTGRLLHTFQTGAPANQVAFAADGQTLAAVCDLPSCALHLWDVTTHREKAWPGHTDPVFGLALHPGGKLAVTAAGDGTVRFWDRTGTPRTLTIGSGTFGATVHGLALTPEGRYLATANDNGTITILKVPAPPLPYSPGPVNKLPDTQKLASQPSPVDACQRADIPEEVLKKAGGGDPDKAPGQLVAVLAAEGHTKQVLAVAFSPDGQLLAWGGDDRMVVLWDLVAGKLRGLLSGHEDNVQSIAFSPDGKMLASAGADGTIRLWNSLGQELRVLQGSRHAVSRVAFRPAGRFPMQLASASQDGSVRLWDPATGRLQRVLTGHRDKAWWVAYSPDGRALASGGGDGAIRLWDPSSGWELASFHPGGHLQHGGFDLANKTLLLSNADSSIHCWDLNTLQLKQRLFGHHECWVVSTAWRADGGLLASVGSHDGTLRLWDLSAHPPQSQVVRLFPPHTSFLLGLAFSPEGRYLSTANPNGTVYLLKLAEPGAVYKVPTH